MLALVLFAALLSGCGAEAEHSAVGALSQLATMDRAVTENGWHNQSLTEITPTHYNDAHGNEIVYYLCHTAYVDGVDANTPELNTAAFQTIIDPATAKNVRPCDVNGMTAAIYETVDLAYLCWTATPEYSFVLEYDPETTDETEIFKMAESIPAVS